MKACRSLFILLFIFISMTVMAQQNATVQVRGIVIDKGVDEPLELVNVRLLNAKDSVFISGAVSAQDGSFVLSKVKPGKYLIEISYIGYTPLFRPLSVSGKNATVNIGKQFLTEGIELGEAVIVAKAAEIVVRNDTVEYNADSYKVVEGAVLEDLLKKMPGVEVSSEGKVTVNGKEIKKVMVDGKEFFSDDPKVASKNLPAKMVDKIQVLDKKSDMAMMTGFDDGDEETVINLTVKPGMKQGWFGNAFAGYGSKDRYEGNFMVNRFVNNDQLSVLGGINNTNNMGFSDISTGTSGGGGRRGGGRFGSGNGITTSGNGGLNFSKEFSSKLTVGGDAMYSHSDKDAQSKSNTQNILTGDSSSYYNELNSSRQKTDNLSVSLRTEWKPDSMTKIIFTPQIGYNHSRNSDISSFNTLAGNMDTVNVGSSNYFSKSDGINFSGRLEFSRKLNDRGRVFSASISGGYSDSQDDGLNYSKTEYYLLSPNQRNEIIDQQFHYDNNSYNYRAFVSWVEPLGHNNFLQATYSLSQQNQKSIKKSYSPDPTNNNDYTLLDSTYSKSYRNDFINQRISLSFKAQREKYNYTIGFNVDPSYSKSINFVGDTTLSNLHRSVVNLSPTAQFNYRFDKRTNLRIDYNGRTSQPSMTQLQPIDDVSDPLNIVRGNPDLKPKYTNDVRLRYQKFLPEKQQAFMISANGNYVINDIVSKQTYEGNSGKKVTTYENVNGNWQANVRAMINSPLKNNRFSINSSTTFAYTNSNGYINGDKNTSKNITASERAGIKFRSDIIDLGLTGSINYNGVTNTLQTQNEQNTFNYGLGGNTTIYLPLNFQIDSDINYSTNSGYAAGYQQNEVLWNASASKSFLKGNQATVRFKIYDILQQRSNISRNVTATSIQNIEYNTLTSYFMFHFIYRFSIFKGGASASDTRGAGGRGGFGGGRPPMM